MEGEEQGDSGSRGERGGSGRHGQASPRGQQHGDLPRGAMDRRRGVGGRGSRARMKGSLGRRLGQCRYGIYLVLCRIQSGVERERLCGVGAGTPLLGKWVVAVSGGFYLVLGPGWLWRLSLCGLRL